MMGFARWTSLIFLFASFADAQNFALVDPSKLEQVTVKTKTYFSGSLDRAGQKSQKCMFAPGTVGWTVAREGRRRLVVFDSKQFRASCKTDLAGPEMMWIEDGHLQVKPSSISNLVLLNKKPSTGTTHVIPEPGTFQNDLCAALEEVEQQPKVRESIGAVAEPECLSGDCKRSSLRELGGNIEDMGNFDLGNRCLIGGKALTKDPACHFKVMLDKAKQCIPEMKAKCADQNCKSNLAYLACVNSSWRNQSLEERFKLLNDIHRPFAKQYGVNPRYAPCLATAETGYLEPMAKAYASCDNENMYTSAGLGMINLSTLETFIANGFRSKNPYFQNPSFYICKNKLFDALGSSPELQLELVAFHMARNLKAYPTVAQALQAYRGCTNCGYENKIMTCVNCLNSRLKDDGTPKGSLDPIHCLSATPEDGAGLVSADVYSAYNTYKRACDR